MSVVDDAGFLKELRGDFLDDATYLLEQCEESYLQLDQPERRAEELGKIFRMAHSLKGGGMAVGFVDLSEFAHGVENCLELLRSHPDYFDADTISVLLRSGDALKERVAMLRMDTPEVWNIDELKNEVKQITVKLEALLTGGEAPLTDAAQTDIANALVLEVIAGAKSQTKTGNTSLKIDSERVENVLNLVGELVVINSQLMTRCAGDKTDPELAHVISLLDKTIRELQDNSLSMRMTPLKNLFLKMQRVVRDLSVNLSKPVEFRMQGEETEIDRTMVELLSDPLMHIVRNSLDHGIEQGELRKQRNKSEKGLIQLSAQQLGGRVIIKIQDDGGGMNRERILQKVLEKNLIPHSQDTKQLTDEQVYQFIFLPGFSTSENITAVSGRGVGMDVVKTNIEELKGSISIESREGVSLCLTISIPLTTAIMTGMTVQVGGEHYVLPLDSISEVINTNGETMVEMHSGGRVLCHRGKMYSMIELSSVVECGNVAHATSSKSMVVLVNSGLRTFALVVDAVLGQTQVVLKPLPANFKGVNCVSGAAILGSGQVGLILDPQGIAKSIGCVETRTNALAA